MNRKDLISFEQFCRNLYRREADARRKRQPEAAAQLDRFADASERRIEEIKCGPLFAEVVSQTISEAV